MTSRSASSSRSSCGVHDLINVKLYSVVITINGITKKYYDCGCK